VLRRCLFPPELTPVGLEWYPCQRFRISSGNWLYSPRSAAPIDRKATGAVAAGVPAGWRRSLQSFAPILAEQLGATEIDRNGFLI
jgi:hypothetical protein